MEHTIITENIPEIVNIVAGFSVNANLNLSHIAMNAMNCEYNPKKFSAAVLRLSEPKTTVKIFPKGKISFTGTKTMTECQEASRKILKVLKKLGYNVHMTDFKIQNIVANCKVDYEISLYQLAQDQLEETKYNPERFPGLSYTLTDVKMKATIFKNGNVVLLGAKEEETIREAWRILSDMLIKYKRDD